MLPTHSYTHSRPPGLIFEGLQQGKARFRAALAIRTSVRRVRNSRRSFFSHRPDATRKPVWGKKCFNTLSYIWNVVIKTCFPHIEKYSPIWDNIHIGFRAIIWLDPRVNIPTLPCPRVGHKRALAWKVDVYNTITEIYIDTGLGTSEIFCTLCFPACYRLLLQS